MPSVYGARKKLSVLSVILLAPIPRISLKEIKSSHYIVVVIIIYFINTSDIQIQVQIRHFIVKDRCCSTADNTSRLLLLVHIREHGGIAPKFWVSVSRGPKHRRISRKFCEVKTWCISRCFIAVAELLLGFVDFCSASSITLLTPRYSVI